MSTKQPNGELEILREYTCGCVVYHDEDGTEFEESGIFCLSWAPIARHKEKLLRGYETETPLFG